LCEAKYQWHSHQSKYKWPDAIAWIKQPNYIMYRLGDCPLLNSRKICQAQGYYENIDVSAKMTF
jgi:hypothetical protein